MPRWVVDASVAVKWYVEEELSPQAKLLRLDTLVAPSLLCTECANAFWRKQRVGNLTAIEAVMAYRLLMNAHLTLYEADGAMGDRALVIANELDHPVYDCVYLALAERLGSQVVTADGRFISAVSGKPGYEQLVLPLRSL